MQYADLRKVTGKMVKEWYAWLRQQDQGCCSVWFESTDKYRYCVCMGWHHCDDEPVVDEKGNQVYEGLVPKYKAVWKVAWKIGRQTHNNIMQCDLDVDFEMPCNPETGDVDDTLEEVECEKIVHPKSWRWSSPKGYRGWDRLAACMRKTARRVYRDWRYKDDGQDE